MAGYLLALGNLFTNAKILAPAGASKQNLNGDWLLRKRSDCYLKQCPLSVKRYKEQCKSSHMKLTEKSEQHRAHLLWRTGPSRMASD